MKKMFSVILACALLLLVTACGGTFPDANTGAQEDTQPKKHEGIKVAFIPKETDESFWQAVENGAEAAAETYGAEFTAYADKAGENSAEKQAAYIDKAVSEKVDAIAFAALDSEYTDEALKKARDAGICVIGFDSDPGEEVRDFFVNQVDPDELADTILEDLKENFGYKYSSDVPANVALVSTNPETPNQNTWIECIKKAYYSDYSIVYTDSGEIDFEACIKNTRENTYTVRDQYSMLKLSTTPEAIIYGGDGDGYEQIHSYLVSHPDTNALISLTTNVVNSCGKAIEACGLTGKCVFNGIAVPGDAKPYLENKIMTTVILWQAYDLGYLAVDVACSAASGDLLNGMTEYVSGLSDEVQVEGSSIYPVSHLVDDSTIYLGGPATFHLDSIDKWKT